MSLTKDLVRNALATVPGPSGKDLVAGEHLLWVSACDTYASVKLQAALDAAGMQALASAAKAAVDAAAAAIGTKVDSFIAEFVDHGGKVVHTARFGAMNPPAVNQNGGANSQPSKPAASAGSGPGHTPIGGLKPQPTPQGKSGALPGVNRVIAVGAGKGGVGKSTIALNLAVALARDGYSVGLLDGDIYGPSMPTMLGLDAMEQVVQRGLLQPFYVHGVKVITIGKLVEAGKPLIWRGPMAHGAFKQLVEQAEWGELDYLVVDLPPGTGDVSLTMAQVLETTGAVVVCTPQKVAQDDAVRAARMFQQLGIEVLGVVENMSYFVGDDGKTYDIFGRGGAEVMAQRLGVPFLGRVPITMALRQNSDSGDPTANFLGNDTAGKALAACLTEVANNVRSQADLASLRQGKAKPTLNIS